MMQFNCKTCGNEFQTKYHSQVYCMNPCTRFYVKKAKRVRVLVNHKNSPSERVKIEVKTEQERTLNARKWLTMPL